MKKLLSVLLVAQVLSPIARADWFNGAFCEEYNSKNERTGFFTMVENVNGMPTGDYRVYFNDALVGQIDIKWNQNNTYTPIKGVTFSAKFSEKAGHGSSFEHRAVEMVGGKPVERLSISASNKTDHNDTYRGTVRLNIPRIGGGPAIVRDENSKTHFICLFGS